MGFFRKHEHDGGQAAHEREVAAAARVANDAYAAWQASKLEQSTPSVAGLVLKKGEVAYLTGEGAVLVEPKRPPAKWVAGSQGVSFRIAKGVRYRVGATRGHLVAQPEQPTPTDQGLFAVTNQRCVFVGTKRTMEWAFSRLVGYSLEESGTAYLNVSNRQKVSGVHYGREAEPRFDAVITAAIAAYQSPEQHQQVVQQLLEEYVAARAAWTTLQGQLPPP